MVLIELEGLLHVNGSTDLQFPSLQEREMGVVRGERVIRVMIIVNLFHNVCWGRGEKGVRG